MLLMRKTYPEESKSKKNEKHNFTFLKSVISLICIRITLETSKNLLYYYWKMLRDLAECLIYVSENWVSQKSDHIRDVQIKLSRSVGFIIYFLHKETRYRKGDAQVFLSDALNSIMATVFVIILKRYPKDHEHAPPDAATAKVVSILLNGYFEKPDLTLLFIRQDIENYQSKDYKGIASFLTNDQCGDFFDESDKFENIRKEFWKSNYCDRVSRERYSFAKKVKRDQDTWDYQEKKKYQEISSDIAEKHDKIKAIEEYNRKDTILWIDNKQRHMKKYLRKTYLNLFLWKGVWRNQRLFDKDPENVPLKAFDFVTHNLSKPLLKNSPSQSLLYYDENETENVLQRKNTRFKGDHWRLLEWDEVFKDTIYINLKNRFFSRKMTREEIKQLDNNYTAYLEKHIFGIKEKEFIMGGKIILNIYIVYRIQNNNANSYVFKEWKNYAY